MKHIFIVNPYAGSMTFANNLRQQLEKIDGFEYFLFNSRYPGNERELAEKMVHFFPDEKLRIYACGGTGTFHYVLEGVGENPNVELAFYPCGQCNDFLKVFNEWDRKRFYDIQELIHGETQLMDSILTNHGRAMNTMSVGLDADMMDLIQTRHPVRFYGISVPYVLYAIGSLIRLKKQDMRVRIDGQNLDGQYDELFFGNGSWLGGVMNIPNGFYPNDGVGGYVLAPSKGRMALMLLIMNLATKNEAYVRKHARVGQVHKMTIGRTDKKEIAVNLDGEIVRAGGDWTIEIRPDSVNFVVPRGVRLS